MLLLQTQPVAGRVEHLAFAPDGRFLLAAAQQSPMVFVWELPSNEPRASVGALSPVTALACGQGGRAASAHQSGMVRVWDVGARRERFRAQAPHCRCLAFSPDGRTLVAGSYSWVGFGSRFRLLRWDVETGAALGSLDGHRGEVGAVAFSPDGRTIASGSRGDRTVRLWDAATGSERAGFVGRIAEWVRRLRGGEPEGQQASLVDGRQIRALAFAPDGRFLAAAVGWGATVWDVAAGTVACSWVGHRQLVDALAFHPDGGTLATAGRDGFVKYWDVGSIAAGTAAERASFNWETGKVYALAFAPDGTRVAAGSAAGRVVLWDAD
jgi:WD40 repeat protein